ncbi:MAG: hypothetical protein JOZ98_19615 [Solirubrobacterales bacterium]|nr:hypothetical protein [Solirubrobacterales bacterium]
MAKKRDEDLMRTLRDNGVRKKVAQAVSEATDGAPNSEQKNLIDRTVEGLRTAADSLESRVGDSRRSESAKKAARTRKRKAAERSAAARRGARTRARAS